MAEHEESPLGGTATKLRGFAALSPERRREIASMGGKAVMSSKFSGARAQEMGRKGGRMSGGKFTIGDKRASEAGRKGGHARAEKAAG